MIFVKANNLASAQLRADQIANKLGAQCLLNDLPENLESETVVFVKDANPILVHRAKAAGCKIVYDPIDTFAYSDRLKWKDWYFLVDTVIAYNEEMAYFLKTWFSRSVVIPHQWDARIEGHVKMDKFRAAYIGWNFNCPTIVPNNGVMMVTNPIDMLNNMAEANCHVSLREPDSLEAKMKPATKVVTAAAVGAIIITTPDSSAIELLPKEYPYWCMTVSSFPKILEKAKTEFNGPIWNRALEMMKDVKEKNSLSAVINKYNLTD